MGGEEEVAQDPGLVDAEDAQGPDQVHVEVAGDVALHPSHDLAAGHRATAREAEADQSPEAETRRKQRRNQEASLERRRTRAGTSRALGMDQPHLGISLVLERSPVPDLRQHRRPSSLLLNTVDCDSSSKLHHRLCASAEERQLAWL